MYSLKTLTAFFSKNRLPELNVSNEPFSSHSVFRRKKKKTPAINCVYNLQKMKMGVRRLGLNMTKSINISVLMGKVDTVEFNDKRFHLYILQTSKDTTFSVGRAVVVWEIRKSGTFYFVRFSPWLWDCFDIYWFIGIVQFYAYLVWNSFFRLIHSQ